MEKVIKQEYVRQIQWNPFIRSHTLVLTDQRLVLKIGNAFWPWMIGKAVFSLTYDQVASISQGRYGFHRNVMIVEASDYKKYRIHLSSKYSEWEGLLRKNNVI